MADADTPAPTQEEEKTPHAGGRPLLFKSVEELEVAIGGYFDTCDPHVEQRVVDCGINNKGETIWKTRAIMTDQQPYTMSGLARHIGIDRDTLLNYGKKQQFFGTIQAARERCHEFAESQLYGRASTGAAFSLKNNWGWKDRQEIDHTSDNKPIPLLAGLVATGPLVVEDDKDDGTASADDSSQEDK